MDIKKKFSHVNVRNSENIFKISCLKCLKRPRRHDSSLILRHHYLQCIRQLGLRKIMKARTFYNDGIRKFVIPVINFSANDYVDMICWKKPEPPLIKYMQDNELKHLIKISAAEFTEEPPSPIPMASLSYPSSRENCEACN